jgi:hypothetical protein
MLRDLRFSRSFLSCVSTLSERICCGMPCSIMASASTSITFWLFSLRRGRIARHSRVNRTTWERAAQLVAAFLPAVRIIHPWPHERFAVNHPRWKPDARIAPAGFCAGGSAMVPTAIAKSVGALPGCPRSLEISRRLMRGSAIYHLSRSFRVDPVLENELQRALNLTSSSCPIVLRLGTGRDSEIGAS